MRIGLIDIDIIHKSPLKALNVELMKIAYYYEKNNWEVELLLPNDDIFCFDKIIVFANKRVPLEQENRIFIQHPNIEYYGEVFTNMHFMPLDLNEINNCPINTNYYTKLLNKLEKTNVYTSNEKEKMLNTNWVRLYPNRHAINFDFMFDGEKYCLVDNDFFNISTWDSTFAVLSIFGRKISFNQELIVRNQQDFDNFVKLINYNFVNVKAEITIGNIEELCNFVTNNKKTIQRYSNRITYNVVYNENNIYNGSFLENRAKELFTLINVFNSEGIKVVKTSYYPHSKNNFAETLLLNLSMYCVTQENNKQTFYKFFSQRNRLKTAVKVHFKHFINTRPNFFYLFSRKFKIKEVNDG